MRNGAGTITERPVRRDPRSGHLIPHPAFEGWRPSEPIRSSWWLVAAGVAFTVGALWVLSRT